MAPQPPANRRASRCRPQPRSAFLGWGRSRGRSPAERVRPPLAHLQLSFTLAREHVAALDRLPRPTLVTCRTGPRSSAVVYLYAGLRAGATADQVLARAEADGAPFCASDELKSWVVRGLAELS